MRNKLFIVLIALFLGLNVQSQEWLQHLPKNKTEYSFYDYQNAFNEYWAPFQVDNNGYYIENGVKKKAAGWKQFKRWAWEKEGQINTKTGAFPEKTAQEVYEEFIKANPQNNTSKSANWSNLGPSSSTGGYAGVGRINCVAFHPSNNSIYWIGAPAGGLWQTSDNGNSWTCLTDNNDVQGVSDIIIPSDYATSHTIYIATGDRDHWDNRSIGVLKSTNSGSTWNNTGLSYNLSDGVLVTRLLIDPNNSQTLIAATNNGAYKTTNGGTTWSNQISSKSFIDMEYKPGNFNTIYGATEAGKIYRSTNGGSTWTQVFNNGNRIELAVSPNNPNLVYAVVVDGSSGLNGIYKSTNSGSSFSQVFSGSTKNLLHWSSDGSGSGGQGWYDLALAASPNDANTVVVGGINSWRSTDGGNSWSIIDHWWGDGVQAVHADKHQLKYRSNGDLVECNDGGIYYSTNDGSVFVDKTNGLIISQMYKLGVSQTVATETITGLQDNGTKLLSGGNWADVKGGDGMECLIDYTNVNTQYGTYVNGQISRTTNHWNSSTAIEPSGAGNGAWVTPYIIDPTDHNTLYAGYADVWKTTNKGNSWTKISTMNTSSKIRSMAIAPSNASTIYVADHNDIWKTVNGGSSWTNITGSLPVSSASIKSIAVKASDANTLWVSFSGYNNYGVYESTNGGSSWTNISAGLPNIPAYSVVQNKQITSEVHLYLGTELGVYFKKGSNNWIEYNTGLPKVKAGELEIYYASNASDSKLRMATFGRGLWETSVELDAANTPTAIATASPGCNTGTVNIASDMSGIQTFYLTQDDGTVISNITENAVSHDFTGLADGIYRGKVENSGEMSALSAPVTLTNMTSPDQPAAITGNDQVCEGTQEVYSVTNDANVNSYAWSIPSGWSGSSNTNTITVTIGANDGTMSVTPSNSCGSGNAQTMAVTVSNSGPTQPDAISGDFTVCAGGTEVYSVTNDPAVETYTWSLPSGWTGSSTTNSISVTVGSNGGSISVTPSNICGSGPSQTADIEVSASVPSQPSTISGNTDVCFGNTELYSVSLEVGVEYTWLLPTGWTGASITNEISVTVGSSNGDITVYPANGCGAGSPRSLAVTSNDIPAQPDAIDGETEVCQGSTQTYSVSNETGLTYNWILPSGWTGSSTTNSITVTIGSGSGDISVTANNTCGESVAQALTVNALDLPADPSDISGNTSICAGTLGETYSIDEIPEADAYLWTIPSGASIVSGDGTSQITVDYADNAQSGVISVQAQNSCGASSIASINITIDQLPDQPGAINGDDEVMESYTYTYSIDEVPGANTYHWTLDASWNLINGAGTNEISIEFPLEQAVSGNLSVIAENSCGSSNASELYIEVYPLGIDEHINEQTVKVHPNPSSGKMILESDYFSGQNIHIIVLSINGKQVYETNMDSKANKIPIDLSFLAAGNYFIKVDAPSINETFKIIINK